MKRGNAWNRELCEINDGKLNATSAGAKVYIIFTQKGVKMKCIYIKGISILVFT